MATFPSMRCQKLQQSNDSLHHCSDDDSDTQIKHINKNSTASLTLGSSLPIKTFIGTSTLKSICDKLKEQAQHQKAQEKIFKKIAKIEETLQLNSQILSCTRDSEDYSFVVAKSLRQYFKELSKLFKNNKEIAELSYLTSRMLKTTFLEKLKNYNADSVVKEYRPYGEPGGVKARTTKLSLSAGIAATPLPSLKGTPGLSVTTSAGYSNIKEYAADDESLFFETIYHRGTGSLSGNLGWNVNENLGASVTGSLTANSAYMTFLEFNDVKVFAQNEGLSLKDPNASFWEKCKYKFRRKSDMQKLFKNEQYTANASGRLSDLLTKFQVQQSSPFKASYPVQTIPLPGYILANSGTAAISAAAKANLNVVPGININSTGIGAGATYHDEFIDIHEFIPESLVECISKNPEKIEEIPTYLLRRIQTLKIENKEHISTLLDEMSKDIKQYCTLVREYDQLVKSKFADKEKRKQLRKDKHAMEDKWGAVGRHQYLQTLLVSHAYIAYKASMLNTQDDEINKLLAEVQKVLLDPEIAYNKYLMTDIANFQYDLRLTIADHRLGFDVNLGNFTGNVSITYRHRVHPSILRDGYYLDISLTGTGGLHLSNFVDASALSQLIVKRAAEAGVILPEGFNMPFDIGADGSVNKLIRYFKPKEYKTFSKENTGWRKQVTRNRTIINVDGSVGLGGNIVPGVSLTGSIGASQNKTKVVKETIESDDIIYYMIRFNRYCRNNARVARNQDWFNFAKLHQVEFEKLFKTLANPSVAQTELGLNFEAANEYALTVLKSQETSTAIQTLRQKLTEALSEYNETPSEDNYQNVLMLITDAFGYMLPHWWAEHMNRWGKPKFLAGRNSALKFGSILKQAFGFTKRGKKIRFQHQDPE